MSWRWWEEGWWNAPDRMSAGRKQLHLHLPLHFTSFQGNPNRISRRPSLESDSDPRFISLFPNGRMRTPVPHGGRIALGREQQVRCYRDARIRKFTEYSTYFDWNETRLIYGDSQSGALLHAAILDSR